MKCLICLLKRGKDLADGGAVAGVMAAVEACAQPVGINSRSNTPSRITLGSRSSRRRSGVLVLNFIIHESQNYMHI